MKSIIYYFTGTGNSLRAAVKIGEKLKNAELVSMRCNPEDVPATDYDVIGFIFPVYHWTMPAPAVKFVESLKINTKAYIFAVAMPSLICGFACERIEELLEKKGAHLSYGNKVNSVANYVIVYPPFPSPKIVVPKTEKKLDKIGLEISSLTKRDYPKAGRMVKARRDKVMNPYLELQKYADYPFIISSDCISCGLCSKVCSCNNIELVEGKPTFQHHCAQCMACIVSCPKRAIGYSLTEGDKSLLNEISKDTPIAKIMGLPAKRKLYKNPYVTVQDLTKEKIILKE